MKSTQWTKPKHDFSDFSSEGHLIQCADETIRTEANKRLALNLPQTVPRGNDTLGEVLRTMANGSPQLALTIVGEFGRRNIRSFRCEGFAWNFQMPVFSRKERAKFFIVIGVEDNDKIRLVDGEWNQNDNQFTPTTMKTFCYTPGVSGLGIGFKTRGKDGKKWIDEALSPYFKSFTNTLGVNKDVENLPQWVRRRRLAALRRSQTPVSGTGRRRRRLVALERIQKLIESRERNHDPA